MAEHSSRLRAPRIRSTAPTVREITSASQTKVKSAKSRHTWSIGRAVNRWLVEIARSDRQPIKLLKQILRLIARPLRLLVPRYFINSWQELKQVTWPGRRETWRLTAAVFIFAIVFGVLIYGVDAALDKIFRETVLR